MPIFIFNNKALIRIRTDSFIFRITFIDLTHVGPSGVIIYLYAIILFWASNSNPNSMILIKAKFLISGLLLFIIYFDKVQQQMSFNELKLKHFFCNRSQYLGAVAEVNR